jgi:enoyl-CoA hydratase/carnithine racemase
MIGCTYSVNEKGIAIMIMDNPPLNAISSFMIEQIKSTVLKIISDDSVRVAVITGNGKAFVAGADIRELAALNGKEESANWIASGQDAYSIIENANKPFIAAVNGIALGGGMELALACHFRIADESAKLGLPEINLGVIPGFGGTQRASRLLGISKALEFILTGNPVTAQEALSIGLVNKVAAKGTVVETAVEFAESIAVKGKPALQAALKAVTEGYSMNMKDAILLERDQFSNLTGTENAREGFSAFFEKRKPQTIDK